MTGSYKWNAQLHAEETAEKEFGEDVEFWDLPEETRTRLYSEALELCSEKAEAQAEWRRDQRMEEAYGH